MRGRGADPWELTELKALAKRRSWDELIAGLRERAREDRRVLTDRWVKRWCGRRFRDIFLAEAVKDAGALAVASRRLSLPGTDISVRTGRDSRSDRERIARRFLHRDQDDWKLDLPPARPQPLDTTLVFCPGLVSTMVPVLAFGKAFPAIEEKHGWRILRARAHPMRSSEANMADLLETIERGLGLDAAGMPIAGRRAEPPGDVFLLGYSKGTPDALTLLVHHPELAARTRALVCWGGAVGGSHLADGVYDAIKDVEIPLGRAAGPVKTLVKGLLPIARLDAIGERLHEFDVKGAVRDLTTWRRAEFNREHAAEIDALEVPIFNVSAVAGPLEVPYFQMQGSIDIAREDGDNDMQVSVPQSRVKAPLATSLAVLHAHHWDISYDPFPPRFRLGAANLDHPFPREAAITALFLLLAELGVID